MITLYDKHMRPNSKWKLQNVTLTESSTWYVSYLFYSPSWPSLPLNALPLYFQRAVTLSRWSRKGSSDRSLLSPPVSLTTTAGSSLTLPPPLQCALCPLGRPIRQGWTRPPTHPPACSLLKKLFSLTSWIGCETGCQGVAQWPWATTLYRYLQTSLVFSNSTPR